MTENIRTFRARSLPEALALVKREMGGDAVILGTRTLSPQGFGRLVGRPQVEITAGPADALPPGTHLAARKRGARQKAAPREALGEYYTRLVAKSVSEDIARRLASDLGRNSDGSKTPVAPDQARARLQRFVAAMIPTCEPMVWREHETHRIALLGPAGAGKTTTLAKLAAHFKLKERKSVAMLSLDTVRLGASQQLEHYARIIDVDFKCAATPPAVHDALREFGVVDVVLIDTPGIGARDHKRLSSIRELLAAADAHEAHLVLPSSMSPAAQAKTAGVFAPFGPSRVVLTKLDDALGFGVILNALDHLELDLSYITVGQRVPQDIIPACSQRIAELILK